MEYTVKIATRHGLNAHLMYLNVKNLYLKEEKSHEYV